MVVTQLEVIGSLKLFEERSLKIKMQIVININIIRKWEQAHKEKTQINLIQRKKGILADVGRNRTTCGLKSMVSQQRNML